MTVVASCSGNANSTFATFLFLAEASCSGGGVAVDAAFAAVGELWDAASELDSYRLERDRRRTRLRRPAPVAAFKPARTVVRTLLSAWWRGASVLGEVADSDDINERRGCAGTGEELELAIMGF